MISRYKGYVIGGMGSETMIEKPDDRTAYYDIIENLKLAKKMKVYIAVPLGSKGGKSEVIAVRPGGATMQEEKNLNEKLMKVITYKKYLFRILPHSGLV